MHFPSKFIALCLIVSMIETSVWAIPKRPGGAPCEIPPLSWEGDTIPPVSFTVTTIENGIENSCLFDNRSYSAQGFAIWQNVGYRLYDTGLCQTYDMSDPDSLSRIATFELGSRMPRNHSNCAQFGQDEDGAPLLYVSGLRSKCFVERITPEGSTLVQIITLLPLEVFNVSSVMNIICGDDGFLWAFGSSLSPNGLTFAKFRKPDISEGDVYLSGLDLIDCWTEDGYVYSKSVWQGGKVYDGRLYFVFGTGTSNRHIVIYDTTTHEKVADIDLNSFIRHELEDCEILPEGIFVVTNGGRNSYLIKPEQDSPGPLTP